MTATAVRAGLRRLNARARSMFTSSARSTRRGTFAFASMAASAAFSSVLACSTGSVIPKGTAVRGSATEFFDSGTGASELIAHLLDVQGDRLDRVATLADPAEVEDADDREDRGDDQHREEHHERRQPHR